MRIVVWSHLAEGAAVAQHLSSFHDMVIVEHKQEVQEAITGADALLLENSRYDQDLVQWLSSSSIRWVQLLSSGFENVIEHGCPQPVQITNAAGVRSAAVAEHAITLLLSLLHAVPKSIEAMKQSAWQPELKLATRGLEGLSALIVGYGDIGREVAQRLNAFGVRVLATSRSEVHSPLIAGYYSLDALDEAASKADVIIVCIAHVPATERLINRCIIERMRPGAVLINVARGAVLDTDAVMDGLQSGHLGAVGLDVTEPEPLPSDHPLWHIPNVLITPHIGAAMTSAAVERLYTLVSQNALRAARGEPLKNVIVGLNPPKAPQL